MNEPAEKPLLVYDGDCGFCRGWILRWRESFGERVVCRPLQEVAPEHPEIPRSDFERAIHYFDEEGQVSTGAEAVARALAHAPGKGWMLFCYRRVPGVRFVSEACYRFVAAHRGGFSRLTRWTVGKDVAPSTYFATQRVFLALLGLVYLVAFASLGSQVLGLVGERGITPAAELLERVRAAVGSASLLDVPTVFWWGASDAALEGACVAGAACGLMVFLGVAPRLFLVFSWVLYLSLSAVGDVFLQFQWDALLLEAGLLAVFFAPPGLLPFHRARSVRRHPSPALLFLMRWLLFRLILLSGLVKLASGDAAWRDFSAMDYHYWTQPLPHVLAWYVHRLPDWLHAASVVAMFAVELAVPFLIFGPRRLRHLACLAILALMGLITATGNYGFFTLLTAVLCVTLVEDRLWLRWLPFLESGERSTPSVSRVRRVTAGTFVALVLVLTSGAAALRLGWMRSWPAPLEPVTDVATRLRSFNAYGLFAVMTTTRPEIVVEGSVDGRTWEPYVFPWKPGELARAPGFAGPHMPRLDWQMWFAALGSWRSQRNGWYTGFVTRLLEGSPEVLALLEEDPFDGDPPRYVRSVRYSYEFRSAEERERTGAWWRRSEPFLYCPTLTLVDGEPTLVR